MEKLNDRKAPDKPKKAGTERARKKYHYRPFDIGFLPPDLALFSPPNKVITGLSINLIAEMTSAYGIQIGILGQILKENMAGIQVAAIGNYVPDGVYGIQISGIVNSGGTCYGICISGLNFRRGLRGIHFGVAGYVVEGDGWGIDASLGLNWAFRFAGIQVASLNKVVLESHAVQIAGLGNLADYRLTGIQVAPANWANGGIRGLQIGLVNVAMPDAGRVLGATYRPDPYPDPIIDPDPAVAGAQLGALGNVAVHVKGVQLGGFVNSAAKTVKGIQLAGLVNHAGGTLYGLQLGLINVAGTVRGVQIGLVNACARVYGFQIGLVNVAAKNRLPFMPVLNAGF